MAFVGLFLDAFAAFLLALNEFGWTERTVRRVIHPIYARWTGLKGVPEAVRRLNNGDTVSRSDPGFRGIKWCFSKYDPHPDYVDVENVRIACFRVVHEGEPEFEDLRGARAYSKWIFAETASGGFVPAGPPNAIENTEDIPEYKSQKAENPAMFAIASVLLIGFLMQLVSFVARNLWRGWGLQNLIGGMPGRTRILNANPRAAFLYLVQEVSLTKRLRESSSASESPLFKENPEGSITAYL